MEHLTDAELARWSALDERYLVEIGRRAISSGSSADALNAEIERLQDEIDDLEFFHASNCEDAIDEIKAAREAFLEWAEGALRVSYENDLPPKLRTVLERLDSAKFYLR